MSTTEVNINSFSHDCLSTAVNLKLVFYMKY